MTAAPLSVYGAPSRILIGGASLTVMYGPVGGGLITNPASADDQGLASAEVLYVDPTGAPAALKETATTVAIQPGGTYFVANQTTDVSVNAASTGHRFSAIAFQAPTPYPPTPQPGTFPPAGATTLTDIIPSYLYQEYNDDEDLQAFVAVYNRLAQVYATWFATISLPVYTSAAIFGTLLDWVAQGLYGITRPALSSGLNRDVGPLNTYAFNGLPFNVRKIVGPNNVVLTTDDVFKRIMTWNFYKGDGNVFNVRWLKRRIMRFLVGTNGTAPNIDQSYAVSVTFAAGGGIAIRLSVGTRSVLGGALLNRFGLNQHVPMNSLRTFFNAPPAPYALESILQEAFNAGVLQLPFQHTVTVII